MLDIFFDWSAFVQLLVLVVLSALMLTASLVWMGWLHRRFANVPKLVPVGPAFAPVATLFALFLRFLAVDIWTQQRLAIDAASKEVTALMRLSELMAPAALAIPRAAPLLAAYRQGVSTEEWGEHFNHRASPGAANALRELRLQAVQMSRDGSPAPLVAQWLKTVDDLEDSRFKRLFIGSDHTDNNQWGVVLSLAFFTYLMIAAAHLDRPPAGRLVLTVFAVATTLALWQLAMHTNPYNGGFTRVTMPDYLTIPSPADPLPASRGAGGNP
jgi:hypothetical protein